MDTGNRFGQPDLETEILQKHFIGARDRQTRAAIDFQNAAIGVMTGENIFIIPGNDIGVINYSIHFRGTMT